MPDIKPFSEPVRIVLEGAEQTVDTVNQALLILSDVDWPGVRDDLHADACETCLKVLDGHRSTVDARNRFVETAGAAGILR